MTNAKVQENLQSAKENKNVNELILSFPHGASIRDCEEIARKAQKIVMAGISGGGMLPTSKYGIYADNVTFSDNQMYYTFGYSHKEDLDKIKKIMGEV